MNTDITQCVALLRGDARHVLRTLPDESVHICITSPPYWGLRDYGIPPSVWSGDPLCEHEWVESRKRHKKSPDRDHSHGGRFADSRGAQGYTKSKAMDVIAGSFCLHCNAWCGCLGLEPSLDQFIRNMVEVFREVRRVLRRDGCCFINMGSSFCSKRMESDEWELREDLTNEERAYVFSELGKHYREKSQTVSGVRRADASPE